MEDIALNKITLSAGGRTFFIPIDPPLKSFSEARERVVKMDQDCIEALGRDSITIKEYRAPRGFDAVIFATCFSTYILLSRPENVSFVFQLVPEFAAFVLKIRLLVLYPMIIIHLVESSLMIRKLQRHSVPLFSKLWWTWTVSCFIEGIGSFRRYDLSCELEVDTNRVHNDRTSAIVNEKRKKQQKH
jgi:Protein of unknown function (DUF2470)